MVELGRPSLASDMLIQRIEQMPQRQVKEQYAEKFLEYKDVVEVEYTANYLDSESLVKVFRDPAGIPFIQFALEPQRLDAAQVDKARAVLSDLLKQRPGHSQAEKALEQLGH